MVFNRAQCVVAWIILIIVFEEITNVKILITTTFNPTVPLKGKTVILLYIACISIISMILHLRCNEAIWLAVWHNIWFNVCIQAISLKNANSRKVIIFDLLYHHNVLDQSWKSLKLSLHASLCYALQFLVNFIIPISTLFRGLRGYNHVSFI